MCVNYFVCSKDELRDNCRLVLYVEHSEPDGETEKNEEVLCNKDKDSGKRNLQENSDETTTRSSHDELERDEGKICSKSYILFGAIDISVSLKMNI